MAWNGSGTFTRTNGTNTGSTLWNSDKTAGTKIRSDRHDTHDQDIASGINNCLTIDGQNVPTANLPMASFKLTGLASGSGNGDSVRYEQVALLAADNDISKATNVQTLTDTDATAVAGPVLKLHRNSASPAASDIIGQIDFDGEDSASNQDTFARLRVEIIDPTTNSEDGRILLSSNVAGALTDVMTIEAGVQIGAPTGGDKGAGAINAAGGLYDNGTRIALAGRVYLGIRTADNTSTSLDFESLIDGTYDEYEIELNELLTASTTDVGLVSSVDNGTNYATTGYKWLAYGANTAGTVLTLNGATASDIKLINNISNTVVQGGASGTIKLKGLNNSSSYFHASFSLDYYRQVTAAWSSLTGAGQRTTAEVINAVRIVTVAGNLVSGTATLFGIRKV